MKFSLTLKNATSTMLVVKPASKKVAEWAAWILTIYSLHSSAAEADSLAAEAVRVKEDRVAQKISSTESMSP